MDDLISRQQAIDALDCINGVEEVLRSLPPVQPERKKGAWMPYDTIPQYVICRCSACGTDILVPCINDKTIYNYCPNCGADMRGEQDDS